MPTIFAFPKSGFVYNDCLYAAIERRGATVVHGQFAMRWLLSRVRRGDVIHLHWPSFDYARRGRLAVALGFARWLAILGAARLRGATIAWTAHNVMPHDRAALPWLDTLGRHLLIGASSRVFVHGVEAGRALARRFPRAAPKFAYVPFGHWIDYYPYPRTLTREAARASLGLAPSTFALLFVGICKPYKNVEGLIDAFRRLDGDAALIVAGKFQDDAYRRLVDERAAGDPRIRILAGYVPDQDLPRYVLASDAMVAPYRETLTSGAAVLALSFGRPIVSIATGHLLDVVTPETGVLYDPAPPDALTRALAKARATAFSEARILEHARRFTFDDAAEKTLSALGFPTR